VEGLVDDWLAAHPDHPAIPHIEDGLARERRRGAGALRGRRRRDGPGIDPDVDDATALDSATETTEDTTADEPAPAG
jgi:hypothetical protein